MFAFRCINEAEIWQTTQGVVPSNSKLMYAACLGPAQHIEPHPELREPSVLFPASSSASSRCAW